MKKLLIIMLAVLIAVALCSCGKKEAFKWPDTPLGNLLPEIEADVEDLSSDEDSISATIKKLKMDEYKDYVSKCKENGFTKKEEYNEYDDSADFTARDEAGNELTLDYYDKDCSLYLYSAAYVKERDAEEKAAEEQEKKEEAEKAEKEKKEKAEKEKKEKAEKEQKEKEQADNTESSSDSDSSSGIDPQFKQTMDDYEAFMNDYADFMEKYQNSDDVLSMSADYADMMEKYNQYMTEIDNIDEDELNEEELKYYNDVQHRVNERLLSVS